jgi:hypothetical protein
MLQQRLHSAQWSNSTVDLRQTFDVQQKRNSTDAWAMTMAVIVLPYLMSPARAIFFAHCFCCC